MAQRAPKTRACLEALERHGLLMLQDGRLPSVTTIVAGVPIAGSWWGHADGNVIFNTAEAIEEHGDVAVAKLIDGKVTYVHRRLWAALVAVGSARETWQARGLSRRARALLKAVDKAGALRTDLAALLSGIDPKEVARAALELEKRLLVHSEEVHTESGSHAKSLEPWGEWTRRAGVAGPFPSAAEGHQALEKAVAALNAEFRAAARLPWQGRVRSRL